MKTFIKIILAKKRLEIKYLSETFIQCENVYFVFLRPTRTAKEKTKNFIMKFEKDCLVL